jgi:hypothetical protein
MIIGCLKKVNQGAKNRILVYFKNPLSPMTLHNLNISKTFKIHYCKQHWLYFLKTWHP